MGKVFKSKIFLGVVCIVLAALIAFLLLPKFYASKSVTTNAVKLNEDDGKHREKLLTLDHVVYHPFLITSAET